MEEKNQFNWQEKEFQKTNKDKGWFLKFFGFFALIIFLSLIFQNYFLGFLLLVSAFSFFIYALKEPRRYNFSLNKDGFLIDNQKIPFEEIKSFWIFIKEKKPDEVSLVLKRKINNNIKIPISPQQETDQIKLFLKKHLKEKNQEESFIDILLERVGF